MSSNDNKIFEDMYIKETYQPNIKSEKTSYGINIKMEIPSERYIDLNFYDICPGLILVNDNSTVIERYTPHDSIIEFEEPENTIAINCVLSGHRQLEIGFDRYLFLQKGDINIYREDKSPELFSYIDKTHILHIIINKRKFLENSNDKHCNKIIEELFDLIEIYPNLVFESDETLKNVLKAIEVFESNDPLLYQAYLKLKTLEIIILIYNSDVHDMKHNKRTYTDAQIRVVRKIKNSLSRDIYSYVSLEVLSASYGINLTTLKNCFKDMYGKPLYKWYREYKFHRAKDLIQNTDYSIGKIANIIGYKSSSKFTKAFKEEMGVLPSDIRKENKKK